jgi:hypothetical protein
MLIGRVRVKRYLALAGFTAASGRIVLIEAETREH